VIYSNFFKPFEPFEYVYEYEYVYVYV